MASRLTLEPGQGNAGTRPSRWGADGKCDPVATYVAPQLGLTPRAAEHAMRSAAQRCAVIIRAFDALGDTERRARFAEPLMAALERRAPPPLCPATWNLAQEADSSEDVAELAYQQEPTDKNLDRLIQAKDREIVREIALRDALLVEQRRRRGQ